MELDEIRNTVEAIKAEVRKAVIGQEDALKLMLIGLLTDGHILLEGVPGTAKTMLAQTFSRTLQLEFGRIQFTPDLMPGDVLGTNLFNFQTNTFSLTKGPIFTQLLLADEINRTPPKTQAALLEAMQERSVTIDGKTHPMKDGFMLVATQNPVENQGTYPLPEAQLDRFLFKHILDYPSRDEERRIVAQHGHRTTMPNLESLGILPVADIGQILAMRERILSIRLTDDQIAYVVDIVRATRESSSISFGASPRAANMIASASRALAVLEGRDFVIPDDIKLLALPALRHRIVLSPSAEIEGLSEDAVISQILSQVAAPR